MELSSLSSDSGITLTVIISAIAATAGTIAAVAAIMNYRLQAKKDKPQYVRKTFLERMGQEGRTVRKIQVLHPSKILRECQILFNDHPLFWDRTGIAVYTIEEGGGGNVVVPDDIFSPNGTVTFKANARVLEKVKFNKIEGSERNEPS